MDGYGGRSSRLKHAARLVSPGQPPWNALCDLGSWVGSPLFSSVKRRGPSDPCRSLSVSDADTEPRTHLKPLTGIREVPVANCSSRLFLSAGHDRMTSQNPATSVTIGGRATADI